MNYIQTFWSGPGVRTGEELYGFTGGWLSAEYHWMSWALSVLQAHKIFGKVGLVTDGPGAEMLVGVLGLPYSRVSTALDGMSGRYPAGLWSMAKIYSYSLQQEPFLHLDGDLILGAAPSDEWLGSPLVCQNIEKDLFFYRATLDRINACFSYLPPPFGRSCYAGREIYSCNAGLFGGTAIAVIQDYCRAAFEFVEKNLSCLGEVQPNDLNFIYEQYLCYCIAKEKGVDVAAFLPEVVEDPLYKELVRFQDVPPAPLIHPVGGFKKLQWVCNSLAKRLRDEYPDSYYRIIESLRGVGTALRSRIYLGKMGDDGAGYERTEAARAWLTRKYGSWDEASLAPQERRSFEEVSRLESASVRHARHLFGEGADLGMCERKEFEVYRGILNLFSLPPGERAECYFRWNPDALVVDVKRKWVNEKSNRIEDIISLNFNCGEDEEVLVSGKVVITPAALQLSVSEYYLDELDALIAEACQEPRSLKDLLSELEECFDPEDIQRDYTAYSGLIEECVKRLLFAGVLVTSEH
ncbi:DUF6734 family protein [Puia sp. P3]|uniref:DUF6734 family protein n=1 Tax=Puia sp. P3 TaxID=3423952 RepID=UPI003D67A2CB